MFLLLIFHPLLRRLFEYISPVDYKIASAFQKNPPTPSHPSADARLDRRVRFDVGFACLYLLALHGTSAFKILAILYINFSLVKNLPKSYLTLATWVFNVGILFANEICKGYPYEEIVGLLSLWSPASATSPSEKTIQNWGTYIDSHSGLLPRWEILFNITVLRLISFNLDYRWSLDRVVGSPVEVSDVVLEVFSIFAC